MRLAPYKKSTPVFIADPVGNGDVWELCHDCPGSGIHELKSPPVVWLLKAILAREPRWIRQDRSVACNMKKECVVKGAAVLSEAPPIDSDDDPRVWEEIVGLLKLLDVFEP